MNTEGELGRSGDVYSGHALDPLRRTAGCSVPVRSWRCRAGRASGELVKPGLGVWTVESARLEGRVSAKVSVSSLQRLSDTPHIGRGDLVMQRYPEQERAAVVGAVVRLGQWVAVKSYTLPDGGVCQALDSVDRLEVVTAEQLAAAIRLDVVHGTHVGRIVQAVVTARRTVPGGVPVRAGCRRNLPRRTQGHLVPQPGQRPPSVGLARLWACPVGNVA